MADYDKVFEDLMYYEETKLKTKTFLSIKDEYTLQRWLTRTAKAKGSFSGKLADKITNTTTYKDIISNNNEYEKIEEKREERIQNISTNRSYAKANKTIYQGKTKQGKTFYYDYKRNKNLTKKEIEEMNKME